MADYLTTNWTEKIKTNPVANLILNNNFVKYKVGSLNEVRQIKVRNGKDIKLISERDSFIRTSDNVYKNTPSK